MNAALDKTRSTVLQPIIINPKTVDTYQDAALLPVESLSQADNIILDDGMIEKVPGTVKVSAGNLTSAAVMGLHRTYSPAGTKRALKMYNGTLYSTSTNDAPNGTTSKFAISVLTNLATNKITPWVDVRGKAYGVNETDGIIRYDAYTGVGVKTGIVGPFLRKKIAFFEDDETWTATNGGSQVTTVNRPEEWTGKALKSLRLDCSAASSQASASCNIPLNLSVFSNGKTVTDNDLISFHTFHGIRNNLSCVMIDFSTKGTDFSHFYRAYIDEEKFTDGDHEWTKFNIRRGAFTMVSGSPDWSKVSAVRITAKSNTIGATTVHFDYMYLKSCPITANETRRDLFNCENSNATWTGTYQSYSTKKQHEGLRSIRLARAGGATSAACALSTSVDLSKWADGASTDTSDELVFHMYFDDITKIDDTNPLIVRVGSSPSDYYTRTFTKLSAAGIDGSNYWVQVRIPKARLSAATGSPNWAAINYLYFQTSSLTSGYYVYIDDCYFEPKTAVKEILGFEDEVITFTGNGEIAVDKVGKGKVTEGTKCLALWSPKGSGLGESYGIWDTSSSPIDLTTWDDGGNSTTDDEICFSLYHTNVKHIEYVEIYLDNNSLATFANCYKYRVTRDMFAYAGAKNKVGKEIRIKKADFEKVGSSGSWSTIGAVKFLSYSKGDKSTSGVYIDNLVLRRKTGVTGRYYYRCVFKMGDVYSACSEASDYIDSTGSRVVLTNVPTSQDSRVTSREIYRMGGSYPNDWGLVKIIEDNTTTVVTDDMDDEEITYFMGDEVPQGWINSVLCNNLTYDPYSDRMYYWGDPTYKNRVWYSHVGFYHVVDEWGYRDFPDDVQFVQPWFGQNIIFYRHSIQKIVDGDLTEGQLINIPANMGACSYWAVGKPWRGMIPYVGYDNVYLFDGLRSQPICDENKGYFKGRESYLSTVNVGLCKDTLYIACKDKTGTPTYNDTVLRCYLPDKSWTILPDWNVNVWCNFDKQDDNNDLYYGDSVTGHVYSINSTGWQFDTSNIAVNVSTGWLSFPDSDIAIHTIEFKAKGTDSSTLTFKGYIDLGATAKTQGTITLTTNWQVYRLGPKGIMDLLRGNNIKLEFTQSGQNAWFKIKDIIIYAEKLSERVSITTANEVVCAAP